MELKRYSKLDSNYLNLIYTTNQFFFSHEFLNYIFSLENTIKTQIIFGFLDLNWDLIVSQFRAVNIEVSGGSNSKKHLFSPNHLKLSQFLLCLLGDQTNEEVVESFHNTSKIHLSKYINYDHKIAKGFF